MPSEAAEHADFTGIRYAQCWEDADVLVEGLDIQPGDVCVGIASAGDNVIAMLTRDPGRVVAVDLSAAQLACVVLRVAAYRELEHSQLLELMGSARCENRGALYQKCRKSLAEDAKAFWDAHPDWIAAGIGSVGKFEHYFALFRKWILPLVQSRSKVEGLLKGGTIEERRKFYFEKWETWRWRLMFKLFFSRRVMGRFGRDPAFFRYVEGSVADRILERSRHALSELNPAENPYLQWILTGTHPHALPMALRKEHFEKIRNNIGRLQWRQGPLEDLLGEMGRNSVDRYNLSDIFEYMAMENYQGMLEKLVQAGRPGGRLLYWNMLAPRRRPETMKDQLRPLTELSRQMHLKDKAFFYSDLVIEEILG